MTAAFYILATAAFYLVAGSWVFRRLIWRLDTMADADFPSDFERDIHRNERAVDDYRHRQELEAEVARLVVSRSALEHRLEDLMDRWGSERNTLVRQLAIRAIDGDRRGRAETLLRCIEELNGAIPGE